VSALGGPSPSSIQPIFKRHGFDGLATLVQTQLEADPFSGQIFAFRGRRGDRIKLLWWDGARPSP
jgi:transposase